MALAALLISFVSLAVAIGSFVYTRRRDHRDRDRRREERGPCFLGGIEPMNDGAWHRLWLELNSTEPLTSLMAELVRGAGVAFTSGQDGVDPAGPPTTARWDAPLAAGHRATWRVALEEDDRAKETLVRATCWRGKESWTVLVMVQVPPRAPRMYVL